MKREYSTIIDITKDLCVYAGKGDTYKCREKLDVIDRMVRDFLAMF